MTLTLDTGDPREQSVDLRLELSLADKMDQLRGDIERTNASILENARQAEFYSKMTADKVRLLNEYRVRLSALTQRAYSESQ